MNKTVLIIEDEPNIVEAISFFLSREGWTVYTHSNGHDAMDVISTKAPDLLVLDGMLPGRSGYEILRDLRENGPNKELPVLVLTARGQTRDQELAKEAGADRFMMKPFSNAELRDTISELVS